MQIYIPSRSRFNESKTLDRLKLNGVLPSKDVFMVVPTKQVKDYKAITQRYGAQLVGCPVTGIARTRQWIGQQAEGKFIMLDDDLRFFFRPETLEDGSPNDKAKLRPIVEMPGGLVQTFALVEQKLDEYAHVAIGSREGNNQLPLPWVFNRRPLRALAYRRKEFLACVHNRVAIMEDFDVTLQLMRKGYANLVTTCFAQDHTMTQMPGGCSDYRTHELHAENVVKLAKLHDPFVKLTWKENKFGGEFAKRQECIIYWKKAYESACKDAGLS